MQIDADVSEKLQKQLSISFLPGVSLSGRGEVASPSMVYSGSALNNVSLGGYSYFAPFCEASMLSVGSYTSVARGFIVGLGHPKDLLTASPVAWRPWLPGCDFPGRVDYQYPHSRIGSDVWIGANVVLMAGVEIGDGCFIGAGSIVTKNIPAYSVAAGNPCRVLRPRFPDDVVARILDLRWFDYDWRGENVDWSTPRNSLDAIEQALASGFGRRFQYFRYTVVGGNVIFERVNHSVAT